MISVNFSSNRLDRPVILPFRPVVALSGNQFMNELENLTTGGLEINGVSGYTLFNSTNNLD